MESILIALALTAGGDLPKDSPGADLAAANSWVRLVDAQNWSESWNAAGTLFKTQMSAPRWASTIQPVREPLGAVASRSLKGITKAGSLPGAPDGQYEIVQFETSFAHKSNAIETVVIAREPSGWKVDGYFIR